MPSPSKKRIAAPVDEKQRITNFFKRATPIPTPSPSSQDARPSYQKAPAHALTSELTRRASSATPEPLSPRNDMPHTSPRVVPILAAAGPRHDGAQRSPTGPPAAMAPPNASFTSASSLASVPCSSSGSSRRIVKDGLMAVTNSDSDSLGDESDDLPDVATFMPAKRTKTERAAVPSTTALSGVAGGSTNSQLRKSRGSTTTSSRPWSQRATTMAPPRPKQNYKYSLAKLVEERQAAEEARARIAAVEASIVQADKTLEDLKAQEASASGENLLSMLEDEDGEGGRMKQAIQRTEALEGFERFEFFSSTQPCAVDFDFPSQFLPKEGWADLLREEESRVQACLTGFVAELGKTGRLPAEVTRWFAVELVRETRAELCEAYVIIIQTCVHHKQAAHGSLSALNTYYPCGWDRETHMQSDSQVLGPWSTADSANAELEPFAGLSYVVRVIQSCAPYAGTDITSRAIADLILAGIDDRISSNMALRIEMGDAIEELVATLPEQEMEQVTDYLRERFFDDERHSSLVQCRIVLSFPATSTLSHKLRRHLALFCITHEQESRALSSPNWPKALLSRLSKGPEFLVNERATDYTLLTNLAAVLDVAIDAGFSSAGHPTLGSPTSVRQPGLFNRSAEKSPAETAFDARIDEFISRIRAMMARIKESGVVHLKRHEAKAALESVLMRLQQSVRTRPPPRKGILDADPDEVQHQKAVMHRFARKPMEETSKLSEGKQ